MLLLFLQISSALIPLVDYKPDMAQFRALAAMLPTPLLPGGTLDPDLLSQAGACDADFSKCPVGFVNVGPIYGSAFYCAADKTVYAGPCAKDPVDFSRYGKMAKQKWAESCNTFWPCIKCTRNFSQCPKRWRSLDDGHCKGPDGDLEFFGILNQRAKEMWSEATGYYWPCKT